MSNVTFSGEKIVGLLTQQVSLYSQLNELAHKQSELVDGGDPEMLLRILAGRQRLIDRVTAIDKELQPYRADWHHTIRMLPDDQQQRARELVEQVQATLTDILARDERDSNILMTQQQQVVGQIRTTAVGRRVNSAYGQSGHLAPVNRYVDVDSQ